LPLDEDSVLLVVDRATIKKIDLIHGQTIWVSRESENLPVSGPPRLLGDSERLFMHDGRSLFRLDPATGSKRWSSVLGIADLSERPLSVAYDDQRFYCVNGGMLRALSLEDGTPVWSHYLQGPDNAIWSLALTQHHVIVFPSVSGQADDAQLENMPVIVRRRETGALVQRFVFPTTIADVALKFDWRGAVVATSRGVWGLASKGARPKAISERTH
jgi:outer membrane protein assembly factor BamB